jgi:hypothetical protein
MKKDYNNPENWNTETEDYIEYPQIEKGKTILYNDEFVTSENLAEKIARIVCGFNDFQGVKRFQSRAGLSELANKWLKKNGHKQMIIKEVYLGGRKEHNPESIYTVSWK